MLEHFERDIFLNFGCPRVILPDDGPQYRSKEFRRLCEKYHIELKSTIRYNPRSNPTERYKQTIEGMNGSFTGDNQRHWDKYIREIQSALRSKVNEITGFTPQFLKYGSELCLDGRDCTMERRKIYQKSKRRAVPLNQRQIEEIFSKRSPKDEIR